MTLTHLVYILIDGLFNSVTLMLASLGMILVFGMLRIINFAHGAIYMVGSYVLWLVYDRYPIPIENLFLRYLAGFGLSVAFIAGLGILLERLMRPFSGKMIESFIVSTGLILFIQGIVQVSFGIDEKAVPGLFGGIVMVGGFSVAQSRLWVIVGGIVISLGLFIFLKRTQTGIAMRAVAQQFDLATLQGINVVAICILGMAIGCGLAAAAGVLIAPIYGINPYIGSELATRCFIVMVLGGIGSFPGAVLASLLVGFSEAASTNLLGSGVGKLVAYSLIITIFVVRPMGLYGGREWKH